MNFYFDKVEQIQERVWEIYVKVANGLFGKGTNLRWETLSEIPGLKKVYKRLAARQEWPSLLAPYYFRADFPRSSSWERSSITWLTMFYVLEPTVNLSNSKPFFLCSPSQNQMKMFSQGSSFTILINISGFLKKLYTNFTNNNIKKNPMQNKNAAMTSFYILVYIKNCSYAKFHHEPWDTEQKYAKE